MKAAANQLQPLPQFPRVEEQFAGCHAPAMKLQASQAVACLQGDLVHQSMRRLGPGLNGRHLLVGKTGLQLGIDLGGLGFRLLRRSSFWLTALLAR